ncbi:uncharacterized protein M421DRAFT_394809 [Didymella exigua CBS 183.55]|uniref:Uncharacterized protein n=1 Tax=Didymella exigua CBS 183.55 TaxID=1150837 RepID=A0A6A5RHN2_9PLEO|nr:uncharacterized protein M421DRAFT_394809 [Didymella exigua CBS 183.55]KAF1926993.1 hypothetical protein M421DRAFT_394809 [Didymella exigua CBS 183.55]
MAPFGGALSASTLSTLFFTSLVSASTTGSSLQPAAVQATSPNSSTATSGTEVNVGAIGRGTVGGVMALMGAMTAVAFLLRRRRRGKLAEAKDARADRNQKLVADLASNEKFVVSSEITSYPDVCPSLQSEIPAELPVTRRNIHEMPERPLIRRLS